MTSSQNTNVHTHSASTRERAVVLLSGGLDSVTALVKAMEQYDVVRAVTANYGQRAFEQEKAAAQQIALHYGIRHFIVDLTWMMTLLPQALGNESDDVVAGLPQGTVQQNRSDVPDSTVNVWVPNRNGVLLNIAAAFAEADGANIIIFGANADEAQGFPDNTEAFRDTVTASLRYSTLNHVRVETPVGQMRKHEMIAYAVAHDMPLDKIWSCYESGKAHCGVCASCKLLKEAIALQQNKVLTVEPAFLA